MRDIEDMVRDFVDGGEEKRAVQAYLIEAEAAIHHLAQLGRTLATHQETLRRLMGEDGRIHFSNLLNGIEHCAEAVGAATLAQQEYVKAHGLDGRT